MSNAFPVFEKARFERAFLLPGRLGESKLGRDWVVAR